MVCCCWLYILELAPFFVWKENVCDVLLLNIYTCRKNRIYKEDILERGKIYIFFFGAQRYRILLVSVLHDVSKSFLVYINLCVFTFVCHVKVKTPSPHCISLVICSERNKTIIKYRSNMKRIYIIMVSSMQQFLHPVYTSFVFF